MIQILYYYIIKEKQILSIHREIDEVLTKDGNDPKITSMSRKLSDSITNLIKNSPKSITYPFDLLQNENILSVISSTDNRFRVYSWDNYLGGTMRFFNQIFQFKSNQQIITKVHLAEKDPQAFFSKIYTVPTAKHENIYLVISNSILSSKYLVQHLTAYKIDSGKLQKVPVFKTKTATIDQISVEYDFFSVIERNERPVELIKLEKNELKVALVKEDLQVTNKNLTYEWNGALFTYIGVK